MFALGWGEREGRWAHARAVPGTRRAPPLLRSVAPLTRAPFDRFPPPRQVLGLPPGDPVLSLQLYEDKVLTSHGGKRWTARIWDLV